MIELVNFSKSYSVKNNIFAVENVDITVPDGQVTGLIGPNGSGKTTIMKGICGFHFPTRGQIFLTDEKNQHISLEDCPELAMDLIGYVPENPALPPELRVLDFLDFAVQAHGLKDNKREEAVRKVIKDCSLEKFLSKKIKTLSKGQKQRVSFAQALIHNPPNLVLDEPVSGLDPAQILQMRTLIQKLSKTKAILISTHILQEIYSLCSSLYVVNQGKIAAAGTEEQIIKQTNSDNLETAFIKLTTSSED